MEGLHAGVPGTAADAQVVHLTPATEQSGLCIYHLAEQHPSDKDPPLHVSGQYCTMEIKVHTDQHGPFGTSDNTRYIVAARECISSSYQYFNQCVDLTGCSFIELAMAASMAINH